MDHTQKISFVYSLALVVFELDVKTLLDTDFHLDGIVHLGVSGQSVHQNVHLFRHIVYPADDGHFQEVPKSYTYGLLEASPPG